MQRSGVMLSLLKSFGRLCPVYGPPAGSAKQPAGAKPLTTVAVEVGLVVVARVVEVEVTVGIEVVEDCVEGVVLVGSGWLRD
jgi:hypothetical protein